MGIIVGVVGLAGYLGRRPAIRFVVAPLIVAGALLVLQNPSLGLVGLMAAAMVVPFAIGTGTQTALNAAFLGVPALALLWLVDTYRRRSFRLVPSGANLPLGVLAIAVTVSWLAGYLPWNPFANFAPLRSQLGGWGIFIFSFLAFWLAANQIMEEVWLRRLVWLFVALGGFYLMGRVVPGLSRIAALFSAGATGSLFWIWLVALTAGQALFNADLGRRLRATLFGFCLLTLGVAWFQGVTWASGWLPPLVALLVLFWLRSPRWGLLWVVVPSAIIFGLNFVKIRDLVLGTGNEFYSWETRLVAWRIVLEIVRANPLLGLGPSNYYFYTPLYPILGYYVRFNSHNNYVDLIAQTGFVGLGAFLWFCAAIAREGLALLRRATGFSRGYVCACIAGLVGMLVAGALGDWFLPFVYNIGVAGFRSSLLSWLFLGGLVALKQMHTGAAARNIA